MLSSNMHAIQFDHANIYNQDISFDICAREIESVALIRKITENIFMSIFSLKYHYKYTMNCFARFIIKTTNLLNIRVFSKEKKNKYINLPVFWGGHGSQGSPHARPTEQQHEALVSFDIIGCSHTRRGDLPVVLYACLKHKDFRMSVNSKYDN